MTELRSYLSGKWLAGSGSPQILLNPATEEPLARASPRGHEVDANEIASPRRQDVVPHVPDDEQPVGVATRRLNLVTTEESEPALAPDGRGDGIRAHGGQQLE